MIDRSRLLVALAVGAVVVFAGALVIAQTATSPPRFEVDPFWPKALPNKWLMGQAAGVSVDRHDHIWVVQRPKSLTEDERGATLTPPRTMSWALLSKQAGSASTQGPRARVPGTLTFLDLLVAGDEHRFVERTLRISRLPADEAAAARATIHAAIPARSGRVT